MACRRPHIVQIPAFADGDGPRRPRRRGVVVVAVCASAHPAATMARSSLGMVVSHLVRAHKMDDVRCGQEKRKRAEIFYRLVPADKGMENRSGRGRTESEMRQERLNRPAGASLVFSSSACSRPTQDLQHGGFGQRARLTMTSPTLQAQPFPTFRAWEHAIGRTGSPRHRRRGGSSPKQKRSCRARRENREGCWAQRARQQQWYDGRRWRPGRDQQPMSAAAQKCQERRPL